VAVRLLLVRQALEVLVRQAMPAEQTVLAFAVALLKREGLISNIAELFVHLDLSPLFAQWQLGVRRAVELAVLLCLPLDEEV
jgi:hypothetical protein